MHLNTTKEPWNAHEMVSQTVQGQDQAPEATCNGLTVTNPSTFWYEAITHDGTSPFIPDGANWKIYRNIVTSYGADNTGKTDTQPAIQNAINGI